MRGASPAPRWGISPPGVLIPSRDRAGLRPGESRRTGSPRPEPARNHADRGPWCEAYGRLRSALGETRLCGSPAHMAPDPECPRRTGGPQAGRVTYRRLEAGRAGHRGGVDQVTTLDGDDLAMGDRLTRNEAAALDRTRGTLVGLGRRPGRTVIPGRTRSSRSRGGPERWRARPTRRWTTRRQRASGRGPGEFGAPRPGRRAATILGPGRECS